MVVLVTILMLMSTACKFSLLPRTRALSTARHFVGINVPKIISIKPPNQQNNPVFDSQPPRFVELTSRKLITQILSTQGIDQATIIQGKSFGTLLRGEDAIIGAETGSGKTFAYFLPLIDRYLHPVNEKLTSLLEQTESDDNQIDHKFYCRAPPERLARFGLILAPTNQLCDQITRMTNNLVCELQQSGACINLERKAESLNTWQENKDKLGQSLTICVATPRAVVESIKGVLHSEPVHPLRLLDFVVLDEADMLLDGSYQHEVEFILDQLKLVRRSMIHDQEITINDRIAQYVLAAATLSTFGKKSVSAYARESFPFAKFIRSQNMHEHHPAIRQDYVQFPDKLLLSKEHVIAVLTQLRRLHYELQDNRHESHQQGDAVNSAMLREWLREVDYGIMIFLNTAANAQQFAEKLWEVLNEDLDGDNQRAEESVDTNDRTYTSVEVHSLVSKEDQRVNLELFRAKKAKLLICTDACARGLDLPHVKRVAQAEFALNVVQHQHRIGRCSRGGKFGASVNFYGDQAQLLVQSIVGHYQLPSMDSERAKGSTIEKSFSRRRGFRQKIKKANRSNKQTDSGF